MQNIVSLSAITLLNIFHKGIRSLPTISIPVKKTDTFFFIFLCPTVTLKWILESPMSQNSQTISFRAQGKTD